MMFTKSGMTLADTVKRIIDDHLVTAAEYDEVMQLAHLDGHIDSHEQVLLRELHAMIADGTIKRVP
jgi:hypothetical protein